MPRLKHSIKVHTLALDLGLKPSENPVDTIVALCDKRVVKTLREFRDCNQPSDLLTILAQKHSTTFEIINNDEDLAKIKDKYLKAGERWFVRLEEELPHNVYGITIKRLSRQPWDPQYVSIIDARGSKAFNANHTKWHELGHLLVMTDQTRLHFNRTFCTQDDKDPEESLVDVVAGYFEYWPKFFAGKLRDKISFQKIEDLRSTICPEASKYSAILGLTKLWPTPCILIEARLEYKKQDRKQLNQQSFGFKDQPQKALRVTSVTINNAARDCGIRFHQNWRVPTKSVIAKVFHDGLATGSAKENLCWWETSTGQRLHPCNI